MYNSPQFCLGYLSFRCAQIPIRCFDILHLDAFWCLRPKRLRSWELPINQTISRDRARPDATGTGVESGQGGPKGSIDTFLQKSLVGGLEHLDYFSIQLGDLHHPNWLSVHHFSEGLAQPPTRSGFTGIIPKKSPSWSELYIALPYN